MCGLTSALQATARLRSCLHFYASGAPCLSASVMRFHQNNLVIYEYKNLTSEARS
jgi:hypothetical protein